MTNQQLMDAGREQMTQTDQAIDRSKMVALRTNSLLSMFFHVKFTGHLSCRLWHKLLKLEHKLLQRYHSK
jgi:hypothetical protein